MTYISDFLCVNEIYYYSSQKKNPPVVKVLTFVGATALVRLFPSTDLEIWRSGHFVNSWLSGLQHRLVKQISPSPCCSMVLIWGKTENCNISWYMPWYCVLEEGGEPYNTIMRMNKNTCVYVFKKTLSWSTRCSNAHLYTSALAKGITFRNLVHHFRWSCVCVYVCTYIHTYIYNLTKAQRQCFKKS